MVKRYANVIDQLKEHTVCQELCRDWRYDG